MKWETLERLAEKKGGKTTNRFTGRFPGMGGGDFDDLKNDVCRWRPYRLCSVDALCLGKDRNKFYFVEFKDTDEPPLGLLRRKAFDSLVVFWLGLGQNLSLSDICKRAVFVYVSPDGCFGASTPSENAFLPPNAVGAAPLDDYGIPIEARLNDLRNLSMYSMVWTISAQEFVRRYKLMLSNSESPSIRKRIRSVAHTERLPHPVLASGERHAVPMDTLRSPGNSSIANGEMFEGIDFLRATSHLDELRWPMSTGNAISPSKVLFHAVSYLEASPTLVFPHNWNAQCFPWTKLCGFVFDAFWQWMMTFHSGESADSLMGRLNLCLFHENSPPLLRSPCGNKSVSVFVANYEVFHKKTFRNRNGNVVEFGLQGYGRPVWWQRILRRFVEVAMRTCTLQHVFQRWLASCPIGYYKDVTTLPMGKFDDYAKKHFRLASRKG